jgi:hypothetical protein
MWSRRLSSIGLWTLAILANLVVVFALTLVAR